MREFKKYVFTLSFLFLFNQNTRGQEIRKLPKPPNLSSSPELSGIRIARNDTTPAPSIPLTPETKGQISFQMDDASIYAQTKIIKFNNLIASEIEPFIRARLSNFGAVQVIDTENSLILTEREPKLTDLVNLVTELDRIGKREFLRLETEIIPVKYTKASKILHVARQRLSSDGTIETDDELNVLIITDLRTKIDLFKEIVRSLDIPLKQVVIQVRVVETERTKTTRVGIDWVDVLSRSQFGYHIERTEQDYPGQKYSYTRNYLDANISAGLDDFLNILNEKGDLKLLASPRVVVVNNKTAEIFVGTSIGYYENRQGGIQLKVTPTIGTSDLITLNIVAGVGGTEQSNYQNIIAQQSTNSTVLVKDKETFILGGITKKSSVKTIRRFPLLGYVLPWIFSKTTYNEIESDLTFFVTPQIVELPPKE